MLQPLFIMMLIWVLTALSTTEAVTLEGSSSLAVSGSDFTLTCRVPDEANIVELYRRPNKTPFGRIQVGNSKCYNNLLSTTTNVVCNPGVCYCSVTSSRLGNTFQWVIQPETRDNGSVWYCRRINPGLSDQILNSPDYTLNIISTLTLSGSSDYAVAGREFTLTCYVPEKASQVQFYRRPGSTLVGSLLVSGGKCYNRSSIPDTSDTLCSPDVCSCTTTPDNYGTVFHWVLRPQTRDSGSVWYCSRTNTKLPQPDQVKFSPNYTLSFASSRSSVDLDPSTTSYTRTEGKTIPTIRCSSDCNPVCTYRWTKDGQFYVEGPDLRLTNIQRSQTGVYRCTASSRFGSKQASNGITVTVVYGPSNTQVNSTSYRLILYEGQTSSAIRCSSDCYPACTYNWTKDGQLYTPNSYLRITNMNRSQQGVYRCTASNSYGSQKASHDITVVMYYGPQSVSLDTETEYLSPAIGETIPPIRCSSACNPACTYNWTKDGQFYTRGSDLRLTNIRRSQAGVYRCTAGNTCGSRVSSNISVTVEYGPDAVSLTPPDTTYNRTEWDTLPNITCTADCRPGCTFVWTKPDNTNFTASPVLSLGQLDRSEHGRYKCTARNIIGEATLAVNLTLSFPPLIESLAYKDGLVDVTENGSKTLICKVDSSPPPIITWYYKTKGTVLLSTPDVLESTYNLTKASCLDTGLYTCSARNSASITTVTEDIKINVLCLPRPDLTEPSILHIGLAIHDNLTMRASFLSNPPPSSFIWIFKNDTESATVLTNGTDNFVTYNIPNTMNQSAISVGIRKDIQPAWFGQYSVTATNTQGNGTITFTVSAKDKPSPPYEGRVTCPTSNTAILSWRSGFNGGAEQTFTVGHRQSGQDNFVIDQTLKPLNDPGQYKQTNITVFHLTPGVQHFFTVYAMNTYGNASFTKELTCTTQAVSSDNFPLIPILGGVAGLAFLIVIVVVVIIRRRKKTAAKNIRDTDTEMLQRQRRSAEYDSDGLKQNVLYESADAQPGPSSEYAVVQKKSKRKDGTLDPSHVDAGETKRSGNVSDVYAEVQKPQSKHGKGKGKEIRDSQADGLKENILYESADAQPGPFSEYAVAQKPSKGKAGTPEQRPVDKGETTPIGSMYAEVQRPKSKLGKDGLKENILYESADAQPGPSSEYAVVQKPSKGNAGALDSEPASQERPKQSGNVSDVYAEVQRPKSKHGKGKKIETDEKQTE